MAFVDTTPDFWSLPHRSSKGSWDAKHLASLQLITSSITSSPFADYPKCSSTVQHSVDSRNLPTAKTVCYTFSPAFKTLQNCQTAWVAGLGTVAGKPSARVLPEHRSPSRESLGESSPRGSLRACHLCGRQKSDQPTVCVDERPHGLEGYVSHE